MESSISGEFNLIVEYENDVIEQYIIRNTTGAIYLSPEQLPLLAQVVEGMQEHYKKVQKTR